MRDGMRDVIVVGGGPVGMMLACLLAAEGLDVEVLERRTEPSMRSRAIGIHPPSLRALARIGVADALIERAVQIEDGVVECDRHRLGRMEFTRVGAEYPFVAALPQYETEALLRQRFDQLAPGRVRGGAIVTGVRDAGDHVDVDVDVDVREAPAAPGRTAQPTEVPTGTAQPTEVPTGTVQARYVVGADGARSVVRAAAGIRFTKYGPPATYLMGDFDTEPLASEQYMHQNGAGSAKTAHSRAVLYFERGGVVESFPLPGGRRRWVAMTDRLSPGASSADLAGIIRWRTGVDVGVPLGPASAFAVQQHLAARLVAGRIALVGDAAHEISPIGGQGMNLGWLDAVQLAPALRRAIRETDAAPSALETYDRRRRRTARTAAVQAGFNMAMGRPRTGALLAARNALVRSLAAPPASALVARAFTMRWL
ncbi:FAD-dependent monooxygenase [Cryobacterium melibiosiphilum]|uniref:FAD-dependent monooxygenase n=2 Tax=Cryobacterium melibiosiphilum TaxID=995039 RepID=A0A3A5MND2_9MICO|nr:FAD-dependent monooxygenase [Cryobacterium melibiosiphilum]